MRFTIRSILFGVHRAEHLIRTLIRHRREMIRELQVLAGQLGIELPESTEAAADVEASGASAQ